MISSLFKFIIIINLIIIFPQFSFANATSDRNIIVNLANDGLFKNAYNFAIKFIKQYPQSQFLPEIIYLTINNNQKTEFDYDFLKNILLAYFEIFELETDIEYYYLSYVLNYFQEYQKADAVSLNLDPDSILYQKYLQTKLILLFNVNNCTAVIENLEMIENKNLINPEYINWDLNYIKYIKDSCNFTLDNSENNLNVLLINLELGNYSISQKIDINIQLAKYFALKHNFDQVKYHINNAYNLTTSIIEKDKINFIEVQLIFNHYSDHIPIVNEDNIHYAIDKINKNLSLENPIEKENSLLIRSWFYYLTGNQKNANKDWNDFLSISQNKSIDNELVLFYLFQKQKKYDLANKIISELITKTPKEKKLNLIFLQVRNNYLANDCSAINNQLSTLNSIDNSKVEDEIILIWGYCLYFEKKYESSVDKLSTLSLSKLSTNNLLVSYIHSLLVLDINEDQLSSTIAYAQQLDNTFGYNLLFPITQLLINDKKWNSILLLNKNVDISNWEIIQKINLHITIANIYYKINNIDQAKKVYFKAFDQSLEIDDNYESTYTIINQWILNLNINERIEIYKQLLLRQDDFQLSNELNFRIGTLYYGELNQPIKAREYLEPLLNSQTSKLKSQVIELITESYIKENNINKAAVFLEQHLPTVAYTHRQKSILIFRLAQIYHSLNNIDQALIYYQRLINEYPKSTLVSKAKNAIADIS